MVHFLTYSLHILQERRAVVRSKYAGQIEEINQHFHANKIDN